MIRIRIHEMNIEEISEKKFSFCFYEIFSYFWFDRN